MKKNLRVKTAILCAWMALNAGLARAQAYNEGFNDITNLAGSGWFMQNNSSPLGITGWFQGTNVGAGGPFDAYSGAANSYIGANFNNTAGTTGTISNWLLTPNRVLRNGDVFTFYTRIPGVGTIYPDRLEVRMSTNGASTNVGTGSTAVGDFTTLLLSVNPALTASGYPITWTQFTITISGLPAPTSGRIAFRYFVTNGGPSANNSDYIGIDEVAYQPYVCPALNITPATLANGTAGSSYSASLSQTGALGTPTFDLTAGGLPPGMTLSTAGAISGTPTATGTFNFTATVSDASGCAGSKSYSITVICQNNPTNFPVLAPLCSNGPAITLDMATPAGGTYSGTGVAAGQFTPTAGTQTITYDYVDPYGCAHNTQQTVTVNTAPTVTQGTVPAICSNASPMALTGGAPAGGTYSGTGVTAGQFDPAAGTQTLTYSYTDNEGCSNSTDFTVTVNTAPTVSQTALPALCSNVAPVTLTGATPAGGTYSGTGVTAGQFDPAAGTQTLTYSYTDSAGCEASTDFIVTVNTAPTVSQTALPALCSNVAPVTLTGGTPAGGTYSGTGVTAGQFDPAAGTQTLTYSYTDSEGCAGSTDFIVAVNTAPTVEFILPPTICVSGTVITLGATPAGGTYTGTGITGTTFSPAAAGTGSHNLTYVYTDAHGCSDEAVSTIEVSACAGIAETSTPAVAAYPNPSTGVFTLSFTDAAPGTLLEVTDLQGKRIHISRLAASGTCTHTLDLSTSPAGVYYLRTTSGNRVAVQKLIRQ